MAIQGLRDSSNFVADERPKNWREGILLLYPNGGKSPLTALTSQMKKKSTDDPEYNWWEKSLSKQRLQVSANVTIGASTLTVSSGALQLKQGHLLRSEATDEVMRVVSDPGSDTSVSVTRAYGETVAATITVASQNPFVHVIGSAYEEGSESPTGINYNPTKKYNYTQIFRNTFEMTRTASQTRLRTKQAATEAKRECLEYHGIEMEKAFILGERLETTYNGKPLRTTRGLVNWIASENVVTAPSSGADMEWLEERLYEIFLFGSSEKMAFCGNRALLAIQQIVRKNTSWEIMSGIKEFGMNVMRLTCPFGELVLKTHPLFNQLRNDASASTATAFSYFGLESDIQVYDMENIVYRPMQDTKYEPMLQNNGVDGLKSGYITDAGLEVHHPETHYRIKGLAYAKADS